MERMERLIKALLILFVLPSLAWGAELRYSENFDDQSLASVPVGTIHYRDYAVPDLTPPGYSWGTGRGGSGYSYGSGSTNIDPWIEWNDIGTWYTQELYVSFWMCYPVWTGTQAWENIKFFYPQFGTGGEKIEVVMGGGTNAGYYMLYADNASAAYDTDGNMAYGYPTLTGQANGSWHHYEFYVNFSTGVTWFKYDGTTAFTRNMGSSWTNNTISRITFGSMDDTAPAIGTYTRFIDDIEVWDGIPDSTPAPPTLSFYLTNPSGSGAAQGSPHNSLGGYRSTTQVSASAMKNLFDDVTVAESIDGDTEYRFLDVYNSGDSSATKVQVFVSSDTTSSGTEITLGYNSTNQPHEDSWNGEAVANEDTAPADPSLTFGTYTRASPLHLGTIPAGRSVRICVKRTVTAGVPWTARDVGTIAVRYLGD
jgi:hypothetical protein